MRCMPLVLALFVAPVWSETLPAQAANDPLVQADDLDALLSGARYNIEVIIFSRQGALSPDPEASTERFGHEPTPAWPDNLFGLLPAANSRVGEAPFPIRAPPECIGYPELPVEEPVPEALRVFLTSAMEPELQGVGSAGKELPDAFQPLTGPTEEPLGLLEPTLSLEQVGTPIPINAPRIVQTPLIQLINLLDGFDRRLRETSYQLHGPANLALSDAASRIDRRADLKVLKHVGWQQRVPERSAPQPVLVGAPNEPLNGTLAVTLGRYLHFSADLRLQGHPLSTPLTPEETSLSPLESAIATLVGEATDTAPPREPTFLSLRQSRRLRSAELHYIDHPALGILVRIDPIAPPPELALAWERWQDFREATTTEPSINP